MEYLKSENSESCSTANVALQIHQIQESQDLILSDLRTDLAQLEVENIVLKRLNAALITECKYWEKMYKALTAKNLRDAGSTRLEHDAKKSDSATSLRVSKRSKPRQSLQLNGQTKSRERKPRAHRIHSESNLQKTFRYFNSRRNKGINTDIRNIRCDYPTRQCPQQPEHYEETYTSCSDLTTARSTTSGFSDRSSYTTDATISKTQCTETYSASKSHQEGQKRHRRKHHRREHSTASDIGCFKFLQNLRPFKYFSTSTGDSRTRSSRNSPVFNKQKMQDTQRQNWY